MTYSVGAPQNSNIIIIILISIISNCPDVSVLRQLERRRSVPTVLSLDRPASLRGLSSVRRQSDGGSDRDQWEEEEEEEEGEDEPELSRSVRSKSLASVTADVDHLMEQDEDDR